jgi:hypothetical protein
MDFFRETFSRILRWAIPQNETLPMQQTVEIKTVTSWGVFIEENRRSG